MDAYVAVCPVWHTKEARMTYRTLVVVWPSEAKPYHAQCGCGWQSKYPVVHRKTAEKHAQTHRKEHA
jgi:hypothetical protein